MYGFHLEGKFCKRTPDRSTWCSCSSLNSPFALGAPMWWGVLQRTLKWNSVCTFCGTWGEGKNHCSSYILRQGLPHPCLLVGFTVLLSQGEKWRVPFVSWDGMPIRILRTTVLEILLSWLVQNVQNAQFGSHHQCPTCVVDVHESWDQRNVGSCCIPCHLSYGYPGLVCILSCARALRDGKVCVWGDNIFPINDI